jgi:threonine dehydrogenase-like Zn-dependent dehydrogenase
MELSDAVLVEILSVGMHAVRMGGVEAGDSVVILGAGRVGLSILKILRAAAACRVLCVDVRAPKVEVALRIGAERAVDATREDPLEAVREFTKGRGADRIFEAVGEAVAAPCGGCPVAWSVDMVRTGGRIVLLGQTEKEYAVPFRRFVWKEAEIVASRISRGDFPRVLDLFERGLLDSSHYVTGTLPLEDAPEAFRMLDGEPPDVIKLLLRHA